MNAVELIKALDGQSIFVCTHPTALLHVSVVHMFPSSQFLGLSIHPRTGSQEGIAQRFFVVQFLETTLHCPLTQVRLKQTEGLSVPGWN